MIQPLHHFQVWLLNIVRFNGFLPWFYGTDEWISPAFLFSAANVYGTSRDMLARQMTRKAVVVMHTPIKPILLHLNHHRTCWRCQLQRLWQACLNETYHFSALRCNRCCSRKTCATSSNRQRALSEANNIERECKASQYHPVSATRGTQCAGPHGKRKINLLQKGGWHCTGSKVIPKHWLHCVERQRWEIV